MDCLDRLSIYIYPICETIYADLGFDWERRRRILKIYVLPKKKAASYLKILFQNKEREKKKFHFLFFFLFHPAAVSCGETTREPESKYFNSFSLETSNSQNISDMFVSFVFIKKEKKMLGSSDSFELQNILQASPQKVFLVYTLKLSHFSSVYFKEQSNKSIITLFFYGSSVVTFALQSSTTTTCLLILTLGFK